MVLRDTTTAYTTMIEPKACGAILGFGVALVRSAANTVKGAMTGDTDAVTGFSVEPADQVELDEDGFYQAVNDAGVTDPLRVARGGVINALVIAKNSEDIVEGDYLEVAPVGDESCYIGVLNEAGSNAGETKTTHSKARALEDQAMGAASYKSPSVSVATGDKTITFTAENLTLLDLSEGDYILLEDLNGDGQLNRVKSLTSTVVTLQLASTVALTAGTDLVRKVFQVKCDILP
jgi:hypothetical protein